MLLSTGHPNTLSSLQIRQHDHHHHCKTTLLPVLNITQRVGTDEGLDYFIDRDIHGLKFSSICSWNKCRVNIIIFQHLCNSLIETVELNEVSTDLIFNWDQTGILLVSSAQ